MVGIIVNRILAFIQNDSFCFNFLLLYTGLNRFQILSFFLSLLGKKNRLEEILSSSLWSESKPHKILVLWAFLPFSSCSLWNCYSHRCVFLLFSYFYYLILLFHTRLLLQLAVVYLLCKKSQQTFMPSNNSIHYVYPSFYGWVIQEGLDGAGACVRLQAMGVGGGGAGEGGLGSWGGGCWDSWEKGIGAAETGVLGHLGAGHSLPSCGLKTSLCGLSMWAGVGFLRALQPWGRLPTWHFRAPAQMFPRKWQKSCPHIDLASGVTRELFLVLCGPPSHCSHWGSKERKQGATQPVSGRGINSLRPVVKLWLPHTSENACVWRVASASLP